MSVLIVQSPSHRRGGNFASDFNDEDGDKYVPSEKAAKLMEQIEEYNAKLDDQVHNMDRKLNMVLKKQEFEYLQAYNIHVKRKEDELKELIHKMNERNTDTSQKD